MVVADEPYELNFTLAKGAAVAGRLVNEPVPRSRAWRSILNGDILPPSLQHSRPRQRPDDEAALPSTAYRCGLQTVRSNSNGDSRSRPFGVRHELETHFVSRRRRRSNRRNNYCLNPPASQNAIALSLGRRTGDRQSGNAGPGDVR